MDCVVCNMTGTAYRLAAGSGGGEPLDVCEQCVAEHFAAADDGACVYCGTTGSFDLVEDRSAVVADGAKREYKVVKPGVVCEDHVGELRREDV